MIAPTIHQSPFSPSQSNLQPPPYPPSTAQPLLLGSPPQQTPYPLPWTQQPSLYPPSAIQPPQLPYPQTQPYPPLTEPHLTPTPQYEPPPNHQTQPYPPPNHSYPPPNSSDQLLFRPTHLLPPSHQPPPNPQVTQTPPSVDFTEIREGMLEIKRGLDELIARYEAISLSPSTKTAAPPLVSSLPPADAHLPPPITSPQPPSKLQHRPPLRPPPHQSHPQTSRLSSPSSLAPPTRRNGPCILEENDQLPSVCSKFSMNATNKQDQQVTTPEIPAAPPWDCSGHLAQLKTMMKISRGNMLPREVPELVREAADRSVQDVRRNATKDSLKSSSSPCFSSVVLAMRVDENIEKWVLEFYEKVCLSTPQISNSLQSPTMTMPCHRNTIWKNVPATQVSSPCVSSVEYTCNFCSSNCTQLHYHCLKFSYYDLCYCYYNKGISVGLIVHKEFVFGQAGKESNSDFQSEERSKYGVEFEEIAEREEEDPSRGLNIKMATSNFANGGESVGVGNPLRDHLIIKIFDPGGTLWDNTSDFLDILKYCQWENGVACRVATLEFYHSEKLMGVVVRSHLGSSTLLVKGAVGNLLEGSSYIQLLDGSMAQLGESAQKLTLETLCEMSSAAWRCRGFAYEQDFSEFRMYDGEDHPAHELLLGPANYSSVENAFIIVRFVGLRDPSCAELFWIELEKIKNPDLLEKALLKFARTHHSWKFMRFPRCSGPTQEGPESYFQHVKNEQLDEISEELKIKWIL